MKRLNTGGGKRGGGTSETRGSQRPGERDIGDYPIESVELSQKKGLNGGSRMQQEEQGSYSEPNRCKNFNTCSRKKEEGDKKKKRKSKEGRRRRMGCRPDRPG